MRAVAAQLQPEDEFAAAREQFAQMEAFLMSDEAHRKTHSELERELEQAGAGAAATVLPGAPGAAGSG